MAGSVNQTQRVYRFESGWRDWNHGYLTLPQTRRVVHAALAHYGLPRIPVYQHRELGVAYYVKFSNKPRISMPRDLFNVPIALHEASHHICDTLVDAELAEHSPEWLGIYLHLLVNARIAPRAALEAGMKAARLEWAPQMTPSRLRKRKK